MLIVQPVTFSQIRVSSSIDAEPSSPRLHCPTSPLSTQSLAPAQQSDRTDRAHVACPEPASAAAMTNTAFPSIHRAITHKTTTPYPPSRTSSQQKTQSGLFSKLPSVADSALGKPSETLGWRTQNQMLTSQKKSPPARHQGKQLAPDATLVAMRKSSELECRNLICSRRHGSQVLSGA